MTTKPQSKLSMPKPFILKIEPRLRRSASTRKRWIALCGCRFTDYWEYEGHRHE